VLALSLAACGPGAGAGGGGFEQGGRELSGNIAIDGSSTLLPFVQAAAERFMSENPGVQIVVGQSGTKRGFEKLCAREVQIAGASRPIDDEEGRACRRNGIAYEEIQVANHGIAVTTNQVLPVDCLTTGQLEELWEEGSDVGNYSELDLELPNQAVSLYAPGPDSETFDLFTTEINDEEGASRTDYRPLPDDSVLAQSVSNDTGALGYLGFSHLQPDQDRLNLVGVDSGEGCVKPSVETIQSGRYEPLSRPLLVYPSEDALDRPEVRAFMDFVTRNHEQLAEAAGVVPMSRQQAAESREKAGF
jgi:phosphate transport system substrate-binding protein